MSTKKIQILGNIAKQAENANTLGGRSASYFAVASEVKELQSLVGDISVSTQISDAVGSLTADDIGVYVQGSEPDNAAQGDIWIDSSKDSNDYVPIDHGHNDASTSRSGFMSAKDKADFDSMREQFATIMINGDSELIITSSTEGSTKRFRITVDDSGAIAVHEVV